MKQFKTSTVIELKEAYDYIRVKLGFKIRPEKWVLNGFDPNFFFDDFINYLHSKVFDNYNDLEDYIINNITKCIIIIIQPNCVIVNNDVEDSFCILKALPLVWLAFKDGDDIKNIQLTTAINSPSIYRRMPIYTNLTFQPNPNKVIKSHYNSWTGFQAKLIPERDVDISKINDILYHIKHIWARGVEKDYQYILEWLKAILTKPWEKTGVAIILQGEQGSGKGFIIDQFLIPLVFGKTISSSEIGINKLTCRFNSSLQGKIFINCNEINSENMSAILRF
jgi:hypothetical protein